MSSFLFDTPAALMIRKLSGKPLLSYPEEQTTYDINEVSRQWTRFPVCDTQENLSTDFRKTCWLEQKLTSRTTGAGGLDSERKATKNPSAQQSGLDAQEIEGSATSGPQHATKDQVILVSWYGESDPDNPENWSFWKKFSVFFIIEYVSTAVYMSASIYSAAQEEVAHEFNISSTVSSLGLGLYVLGYGVGPMLLSPPSELPSVGRNVPYVVAMTIYVLISVPAALSQNIATLLVLRFIQGSSGLRYSPRAGLLWVMLAVNQTSLMHFIL
jgi:hypothetical protein